MREAFSAGRYLGCKGWMGGSSLSIPDRRKEESKSYRALVMVLDSRQGPAGEEEKQAHRGLPSGDQRCHRILEKSLRWTMGHQRLDTKRRPHTKLFFFLQCSPVTH